jgi:hypothetical protein
MTLRNVRLVTTAAFSLCLLALLSACGGGGAAPSQQPGPSGGNIQRVTAEWLASQPGVTAGEFSLHLLDSNNQPLPWRGLTVRADGSDLTVEAGGNPPEDAFIYVSYPSERLAFSGAELDARRTDDYLIIASPGRIPNVLPVGVSRIGRSRERALDGGPLLRICFAAGPERSSSAVTTDPATAPVLELGLVNAGTVQLKWEERNLGDYDNNGVVTIADLSPLGKYFLQPVNGDPKLVLVDGDENGQLTIADISKIGKNLSTQVAGYAVVRTPLGGWTVQRTDVLAATPEPLRKQRLQYTFDAPFIAGTANNYVVSAIDAEGNRGVDSNIVVYTAPSANLPPVWDTTEGITSVTPITGGLRLTFGSGNDPEGGPIEYVLRYNTVPKAPGAGDATEVVIPPGVTAGSPPYTYDLTGITPGVAYNMRISLQDQEGLRSTNVDVATGKVPALGASSDPWAYGRGNIARTGMNAGVAITAPLELDWSVDLSLPGSGVVNPLVSSSGWVGVASSAGISRLDSITGSVLLPKTGNTLWNWSLDGNFVAFTDLGSNNTQTYDFGTAALQIFPIISAEPLLLGDYLIAVGADSVQKYNAVTGMADWTLPAPLGDQWGRTPAVSGGYMYIVSDNGRVSKIDLLSGGEVDFQQLPADAMNVLSLAVDSARGRLYAADDNNYFDVLSTDDLSILHSEPKPGGLSTFAPVIIDDTDTHVVLFGSTETNGPTQDWTLHAHSLDDYTEQWTFAGGATTDITLDHITADSSRIYISTDSRITILDFSGELRQRFDAGGGQINSDVVPAGSRLYIAAGSGLHSLQAAAVDNPPVWQGVSAKPGGGIRDLTENAGTITVSWDYATDELGQAVRYAVYWSETLPPNFNNPGPETHIITDILDNGTGSHSVDFDPGSSKRIYVGVRAYDAPWAEPHQIDSNTNWLAVTPGWAREELVTGTQLPAGEIFYMRGATRNDGSLGVSYYDTNTQHITYLFGNTGGWSYEDNPFTSWTVNAIDHVETANGARMAICDSSVAALNRTGSNAWTRFGVQGTTQPELNPQISIARAGAQGALAYNEHVAGNFPNPETHYFSSFLQGGQWQAAQEVDDENFSGRDLGMTYCQGNPLLAYQLGLNYASNRLTPTRGLLRMARWNGTSWDKFILDPGVNTDDDPLTVESDCGKRIKVVASGNIIHMAYMDLEAQTPGGDPRGQLKYGVYDPVAGTFDITPLSSFDLTIQPGSNQYTWGELGLTLSGGEPVITFLSRDTGPNGTQPHYGTLWAWDHRSGTWAQTKLGDEELLFPSDREPCFVLRDGAGKLHAFFASSTKDIGQGPVCDKLVHVYEK